MLWCSEQFLWANKMKASYSLMESQVPLIHDPITPSKSSESDMLSQNEKNEVKNRTEKLFKIWDVTDIVCVPQMCVFMNTIPLFSIKLKVSGLNSRDKYVMLSRPWNYFCHFTLGLPFLLTSAHMKKCKNMVGYFLEYWRTVLNGDNKKSH